MASNKQRQKAAYRQTCQKLTGEHRDVMKAMEAYIKNSELKKDFPFAESWQRNYTEHSGRGRR